MSEKDYKIERFVRIPSFFERHFKEGQIDVDFSKACFAAKLNTIFTYPMNGAVQIVQVTERTKMVKKVKLCVLQRKVTAGQQTYGQIYSQASQYIAQNQTAAAFQDSARAEKGLYLRTYTLTKNDYRVGGLDDSRKLVRWAFENNAGDVSEEVFECGSNFVLMMVDKVIPAGDKAFDDVKEQVRMAVVQDKKGDKMIEDMKALIADFNEYRKTHNQGVFDAYTPSIRRARSNGLVTGLPDGYGRGRIIGDYRRIALYGIDYLMEQKMNDWNNMVIDVMDEETIREREEIFDQIKALNDLKEMALKYGYDISKPAKNAKEAVQWTYFGYLAAIKENNGAAMSLGRVDAFLDIYFTRDIENGVCVVVTRHNREKTVVPIEDMIGNSNGLSQANTGANAGDGYDSATKGEHPAIMDEHPNIKNNTHYRRMVNTFEYIRTLKPVKVIR